MSDPRPLLTAKLRVPSVSSSTVVRSRLHERLGSTTSVPLTTVVAPAGWGKSTLLAAWARDPEREGRVAWLSLDEADDEPVRFWTYAVSALGAVAPQLTRDSLAALAAPGMDPVGPAVSALLNACSAAEDSHVLVLDDFHVLRDPMIHQSVEFLLTYLPHALRLVIASREDPPLPLARMRARGTLEEVRVHDLRCTAAEGLELLSGVSGRSRIVTESGPQLVERTEGWPAGLQLAALTLRESVDGNATAAELRGDARHILDYFAAEVLPVLGRRQRELLVTCSPLERLSGPLCGAVLGTDDADDVLEELERLGLFVTALGGGWYRCHRLFREVLRRELDRDPTTDASEVLRRAADWFLTEGRLEEAIEHRTAAGDHFGASELLLTGDRWFMDRGATATFLLLGERLAATVTDPRLLVALAVAAGEAGQGERCTHWLELAEPLIHDDTAPLPGWRSLRSEVDVLRASFPQAADAEAALLLTRRAADLEDDPTMVGYVVARQAWGGALLGAGLVREAKEVLEDCWRAPARRDLPSLLLLQTAGLLAQVLIDLGDLEGARHITREVHAVAKAAEEAWGRGAAAALATLRLADARLIMATDPRAALPAMQAAAELAEGWGWPTIVLTALPHLASAQWAVGDGSGARVTLARAWEVARTGEARPEAVRRLRDLEARIGRATVRAVGAEGGLVEELTDRELAILRALRGPLTAREIGLEMYLSINTVKGYTKSLYRKLGVVTRSDAVRRGHDLGLI